MACFRKQLTLREHVTRHSALFTFYVLRITPIGFLCGRIFCAQNITPRLSFDSGCVAVKHPLSKTSGVAHPHSTFCGLLIIIYHVSRFMFHVSRMMGRVTQQIACMGATHALDLNRCVENAKLGLEFVIDMLQEFVGGFACVLFHQHMGAQRIVIGTQ